MVVCLFVRLFLCLSDLRSFALLSFALCCYVLFGVLWFGVFGVVLFCVVLFYCGWLCLSVCVGVLCRCFVVFGLLLCVCLFVCVFVV